MNNRVIKFRVWDKYHNCYLIENGKYLEDPYHLLGRESYLFQQFTGLHDKNGVEIYEGDIVASPHFTDVAGRKHILKHLVEWSEKYHGWFLANAKSKDGTGSIQMFVVQNADLEVIGNVYENPELLKD